MFRKFGNKVEGLNTAAKEKFLKNEQKRSSYVRWAQKIQAIGNRH